MLANSPAGSPKQLASPATRCRAKLGLRAAALVATAAMFAGGPQSSQAQYYYQIGPKRLYQSADADTRHRNIPLVMRDAIQNFTVGTRLLPVNSRIIGGAPAPVGIYPWMASIGLKGVDPQDGHFCGGAFIAPDWVITAAHCVNKEVADKIQVLGNTNALSEGGTIHLVDRVVSHEQYDENTSNHDVALLHISSRFSARTLPLLSAAEAERFAAPGSLAVVAGWGMTAEGSEVVNALRHVTVLIRDNMGCNGLAAYSGAVTDQMLCAGFAEGGKDSCQGDSGGPLMVPDRAGGFFLAGIVSWGEGCGRLNKAGVYTRVSTIQAWVADKISNDGAVGAPTAAPKRNARTTRSRGANNAPNPRPATAPIRQVERALEIQIGPRTLYPQPSGGQTDLPLAMRDALQHIETGKRLLAVKPRIMGGEPSPAGAYPWAASLGMKNNNPRDGHFCGGSFIAPNWVITAAHCVKADSASKIQVYGGNNNLDGGGTVYPVDRIVIHEKYDAGTQENDVALVHLTKPYTGKTMRLLSAADAGRLASPGTSAVVVGWGLTVEGGDVQNTQRRVTVRILSNEACNSAAAYGGSITSGMLCAGFAAGGKDSCQGDSGGPLTIDDGAGDRIQAGVVSWGEGCGRLNKFGVYTRVSSIQAWAAGKIGSGRGVSETEPLKPKVRGKAAGNSRAAVPRPTSQTRAKPLNRTTDVKNGGPRAQADEHEITREISRE